MGDHIWGWPGDVVDAFTIVTAFSGICTSLGLGAIQISAGLRRVGAIDPDLFYENTALHVICICVVTCVATLSVVSGLNYGI
jgi:choline-glycine betaine transporter